ncbi:MAG: type II secretion system F family protein [Candidatus Omnitrophica bacterium]|nr:type II secretion system F family protein [Candidatus Omnitrophota bacterium]
MPIKIILFLVVFAGVFYLASMAYPFFEALMDRWQRKRMDKITPKLDRMFLDIPLNKLLLIDVLSPLASGLLVFFISRNIWAATAGAVVGLAFPILIIKRLEAMRRQKFAAQLVDGLMILSSSLKAGLSLLQSFEELVQEMPNPISQEFGLVIRQMQMGVSLEEAITKLKVRMRLDELDMVVTAMLVARETGGDLTQTFSRVIYTIQERNKLIGRVKALCVQANMQGVIMSLLPILFGIFVYKVNPGFFDVFLKDNFGRGLMLYAIISEILGIIFIRKLSKVDI